MKRHLLLIFFTSLLLTSCNIPYDSEETFKKSHDFPLRVGIVNSSDTVTSQINYEQQLMDQFVQEKNLKVQYKKGAETQLMHLLEKDSLDVVLGNFTKKTIWKKKAGLTAPYDKKHLWLIKKGENRLLFEIENYFHTIKK